ncbi:MAG TPA: hypothetical protein VD978_30170 [Azospirillum sp.]|nr:hypothetical protein [Azospirillum sp.]
MDDGFIAKPLGKRQVDQAFPVVRAILPNLALDRWRAFAAARLDRTQGASGPAVIRAGIMTVQNERGYIHGLFSYSADDHLHHGCVLTVENFIVHDLFNLPDVAATLLRAMDTIARDLGCSAIHTNLPETYAMLSDYCNSVLASFRAEGHTVETLRLCKPLDGTNDNRVQPPATIQDAE